MFASLTGNRRWVLVGAYFFLTIFVVILLFPPYAMLVISLKTNRELAGEIGNVLYFKHGATLDNYVSLFRDTHFLVQLRNTIEVSLVCVAITLAVSIPAAYALARLRFWGDTALAAGVFLTYLVPETLLFLPFFKMFGAVGLFNSKWSLVAVYPTATIPFCTWILIGYFSSIPRELDEAALVDGAGHREMLLRVFLPVALPGVIAASIFAFTVAWSNFLYPMAFLFSSSEMVLTVGTAVLGRSQVAMAGALLGALPPVLLYAFLMDFYVAGLTTGAIR